MSEYTEPTKFIDLESQQKKIRRAIEESIFNVLDHGQYIMGPEVLDFEKDLLAFTKSKHAITCGNGTDALTIALMSWNIGPGDAVFVPSFTYVATAEAPAQIGATPFFIDVSRNSFNVELNSFKQAIIDSKKLGLVPKAIIPVDLFGQISITDELISIANENNINVLVDGAQSFGAELNEVKTGNFGDITTTSFFPAKPLGCYGDGGAIFTNNDDLAEKIRSIRLHGKGSQKYDNIRVGVNSRLDTIQAAILREKIKIFGDELVMRDSIAKYYSKNLSSFVRTPIIRKNSKSAWAQYTIQLPKRNELQSFLKDRNIPSITYYPIPLSQQIGYSHFPSVSSGLSSSEELPTSVLSLPMSPYMETATLDNIINSISEFCTLNNISSKHD